MPEMESTSPQGIEALFELHAGAVYGYLLRLSGDPAAADELTNETFLRAMLALDGFRGDASVRTWLIRIGRNLYLNRARRDSRTTSLDALTEKGVSFRAGQPEPEPAALDRERGRELQAALLTLSETDRSLLLLTSQEKLSYREVSRILGISVAAVKVRVFRARQRLAKVLDKG